MGAYGLAAFFVNSVLAATPHKLLAFGDSLTVGYNLPPGQSFASRLEAALRKEGYDVRVLNGGVSGDTSADGLARLDWALADNPDTAIVELGANDMLRGLDPALTYANLDAILTRLEEKHVKVLLAGMMAPRNLGADYIQAFDAVFPRLQQKHKVALYPFFLDGVALNLTLLQADGMHPTAEGVAVIVRNILPMARLLLGPP